jgi:DNA transformation protein and related proteins
MAVSPGFAAFVAEQLEGCGPIVTRRMFGGLGIYAHDIFFAIIDDDILYLKVDDTTRADFEAAGCRAFRPYGDDRQSIHYYEVPVAVLEDASELAQWGRKAIAVARAAKAKKRGPQAATGKNPRRPTGARTQNSRTRSN